MKTILQTLTIAATLLLLGPALDASSARQSPTSHALAALATAK